MEVVYHSHVLEHFMKDKGEYFIKECFRVLKPGGIIRIAIPDLEQLARQYLNSLEKAVAENNELNAENYNWSVIEMFDQMIRNQSGGEMGKYWMRERLLNEQHIIGRVGYEFKNFRERYLNDVNNNTTGVAPIAKKNKLSINRIKTKIRSLLSQKNKNNSPYSKIGMFRSSGEIHQWMYDRYSLKELLMKNGFRDVKQVDAFSSTIHKWEDFISLDVENDEVRKPDSLFMEAVK